MENLLFLGVPILKHFSRPVKSVNDLATFPKQKGAWSSSQRFFTVFRALDLRNLGPNSAPFQSKKVWFFPQC